jgi:hypothetical protein
MLKEQKDGVGPIVMKLDTFNVTSLLKAMACYTEYGPMLGLTGAVDAICLIQLGCQIFPQVSFDTIEIKIDALDSMMLIMVIAFAFEIGSAIGVILQDDLYHLANFAIELTEELDRKAGEEEAEEAKP